MAKTSFGYALIVGLKLFAIGILSSVISGLVGGLIGLILSLFSIKYIGSLISIIMGIILFGYFVIIWRNWVFAR